MRRQQHDYAVLVFAGDELLIETWNDGIGSVCAEIGATKARIDDPADAATHMAVCGLLPLADQPWAALTGYTTPRTGKPTPREALKARLGKSHARLS